MASAANATDAISRRVRPSKRGQRSVSHQPNRQRNRPGWWQAAQKSEESSQQEGDGPSKAAYKLAIKTFGPPQTAGLFPDDHPAIRSRKAELVQATSASDESVLFGKRIRAGQNHLHARKIPQRSQRARGRGDDEHHCCPKELGAAPSQGGGRRKGPCKSEGPNWNICIDKQGRSVSSSTLSVAASRYGMETVANPPTDDALQGQAAMPTDGRSKVTETGTRQTRN